MTNLAFGTSTTFISYIGSRFNDPSGAKDNFTPGSGILAVSKDQISTTAYYDYFPLGGSPQPPAPSPSPSPTPTPPPGRGALGQPGQRPEHFGLPFCGLPAMLWPVSLLTWRCRA